MSKRKPTALHALPAYGLGIVVWHAENLWFNHGSLPGNRTGFMRHDNGMNAVLLLNAKLDPAAGENPLILAMQNILLHLVKNTAYPWQDTDQF